MIPAYGGSKQYAPINLEGGGGGANGKDPYNAFFKI